MQQHNIKSKSDIALQLIIELVELLLLRLSFLQSSASDATQTCSSVPGVLCRSEQSSADVGSYSYTTPIETFNFGFVLRISYQSLLSEVYFNIHAWYDSYYTLYVHHKQFIDLESFY